MITTTLAVIALAGGIGSGTVPSVPNWQTDYSQALKRASSEGKPMAVFIGQGADSHKKMLADGTVTNEAAKLLKDSYVCLYLDSDTTSGKELAGRFEMSSGLVISSPGGTLQAYRHSGTVAATELTRSLKQFASAGQPTTTVNNGLPAYPPTYRIAPTYYVSPFGGTPNCVGPR